MKITNKYNLPESLVNYANSDHEYKPNRYSVTELLAPPREIILNRMFNDYLEKDVSDEVVALFGSAFHHILELNTPKDDNIKTEYKIEFSVNDFVISGIIDMIDYKNEKITDYKTSTVSKVQKGDFEEYRKQGLAYALGIFRTENVIVRHLEFPVFMKDWSKVRASKDSNYPQTPVYMWRYDIQDSDFDYIEDFIKHRLMILKIAFTTKLLPICNNEEKWYTGDTFAVYEGKSDSKAKRLFDTKQEAEDYVANKLGGKGRVEERKGENIKCNYYCKVCKYCEEVNNNSVREIH